MAFKMKGFPFSGKSPIRQEITKEMIEEKNKVEKQFNNLLAKEGYHTDTDLSNASEELKALKKKFEELRKPFIKENMAELKKKKENKEGLWSED
tara:strand:+ start:262 stop:543 length:282 start_codon:yes stop_codon:yes gene_type:complete